MFSLGRWKPTVLKILREQIEYIHEPNVTKLSTLIQQLIKPLPSPPSSTQGKPYPSAGFTAAYIMAHEIGHNLGMFHDSQQNACAKDGYIRSPSRGVKGETTWSSCSRDTLRSMP